MRWHQKHQKGLVSTGGKTNHKSPHKIHRALPIGGVYPIINSQNPNLPVPLAPPLRLRNIKYNIFKLLLSTPTLIEDFYRHYHNLSTVSLSPEWRLIPFSFHQRPSDI